MLDDFCKLAQTKKPMGQTAVLRDNAESSRRSVSRNRSLPPGGRFSSPRGKRSGRRRNLAPRPPISGAAAHGVEPRQSYVRQIVETVYLATGATAVFESNPFERRFRDMHAVSQQSQSQFSIYEADWPAFSLACRTVAAALTTARCCGSARFQFA